MTARTLPVLAATELPPPRAYGTHAADLDLRFDGANRPAHTTAVLACCAVTATPENESFAWSLPLGERLLRLLRVVALTENSPSLTATLRCPQRSCRQPFELALPFAQLLSLGESSRPIGDIVPFPRAAGETLQLRLPTGRDQAAWQSRNYADRRAAVVDIVQTLLPSGATVSPTEIEPLAAAMEAADPLVAFHVQTACPHCGEACDEPVDLEAIALEALARRRRQLLQEIHFFATHYGWTERDVLHVPPERRAEYRRLVMSSESPPA